MKKIITKCPICDHNLVVNSLHCSNCHTNIQGNFELTTSPFSNLDPDQLNFILTFIRCEGKFNRMEEELGLSYPTLRNRFNMILHVMGFEAESEDDTLNDDSRKDILEQLNKGEISIEEAQELLRGK